MTQTETDTDKNIFDYASTILDNINQAKEDLNITFKRKNKTARGNEDAEFSASESLA